MKLKFRAKLEKIVGKYYRSDARIYKIVGYHDYRFERQDGFYLELGYGEEITFSEFYTYDKIDKLSNSEVSDKIMDLLCSSDLLKKTHGWYLPITTISYELKGDKFECYSFEYGTRHIHCGTIKSERQLFQRFDCIAIYDPVEEIFNVQSLYRIARAGIKKHLV